MTNDSPDGEAAIAIDGMRVVHDGRTALSLDRWSFAAGAHGLVVGPSGSGKTTLLHAIAGLFDPDHGAVRLFGRDWRDFAPTARDRRRGRMVGLVFQSPRLIRALTVRDNIALPARLAGEAVEAARLDAVIARLDLGHCAGRKPDGLSQGEATRAGLARALIMRPKILLADEPTSALDDMRAAAAADLLTSEAEAVGAALLIVTHDARLKTRFPVVLDLGDAS